MNCIHAAYKTVIVIQILLGMALPCVAQKSITDTLVPLKETDVSASRLDEFTVGSRIVRIDSSAMATCRTLTASDLLSLLSLVSVKSYGAGSLASISMRGTGAAHVAVLWNGFSLQSPMNGGTDVSLLPVFFADRVTLQYGGSGALVGSGALGGSIHFANKPVFEKGWNITSGLAAGSFSDYTGQFAARFGGKKTVSSTRFFYHNSKNNYPFANITLPGKPEVRLSHASVVSCGILQENYLKIHKNQEMNLRIWCQNEQREIPPLMTKPLSTATQDDRFARLSAGWQRTAAKADLSVRTGLFLDDQHYLNPDINTDATLTSLVSATEAETSVRLCKGNILNAGINLTFAKANSDNYDETAHQQNSSVFVAWKVINKTATLKGTVSLREAMTDGKLLNPVPSAGIEWNFVKGLTIYANGSGVYRLPTLNDRYWVPGGDPDLDPEQGWTEEAGLRYDFLSDAFNAGADISAYNSNISNWIIWLPRDSYWSPRNLMDVWSRGAEARISAALRYDRWLFKVSTSANYVKSTNQRSKYENDASVGKQIIYVPKVSAQGQVEINWRQWQLLYLHTYSGKRYTTSDNSYFIDPYHIATVNISRKISMARCAIDIYASVANLWNTSYQAIAWMPGTGRSYRAGMILSIDGKK